MLTLCDETLRDIRNNRFLRPKGSCFEDGRFERAVMPALFAEPDLELREHAVSLCAKGIIRAHPLTVVLLRALGIDPLVALLLTTFVRDLKVIHDDDPERHVAIVRDSDADIIFNRAPTLRWKAEDHMLVMPAMPGQVVSAFGGMALSRIIGKESIDAVGARVSHARTERGATLLQLATITAATGDALVRLAS